MLRLLMAATVLCVTSVATAGAPGREADAASLAAERMAEGRALFAVGKLTEARAAFGEAFAAVGTPQQAANLGTVELLLARYRDAAEHLHLALLGLELAPHEDGTPSAIDEVRRSFEQATREVGAIEVRVSEHAAVVELDGVIVDLSKSSVVFVEPGAHALSASAPGCSDARVELTIERGERRTIDLILPPQPAPAREVAGPPAPAAPAARSEPERRALGPAFATGTVALVGITAGALLLRVAEDQGALAQKGAANLRQQNALCRPTTPGFQAACQEVKEAASAHNTLQSAGVGAFVVGGVALLAGVTYLLWPHPSPSRARVQAAPLMDGSTRGAVLRARF